MLSTVYSAALEGVDGYIVTVECNASISIPHFEIVGLADLAVREAKERVFAAAQNSGYSLSGLGITLNLAPADKHKVGSALDLPMLIAVLCCTGDIKKEQMPQDACFIGESVSVRSSTRGQWRTIYGRRRAKSGKNNRICSCRQCSRGSSDTRCYHIWCTKYQPTVCPSQRGKTNRPANVQRGCYEHRNRYPFSS